MLPESRTVGEEVIEKSFYGENPLVNWFCKRSLKMQVTS